MIKGYHGLIMQEYEALRRREEEALEERKASVRKRAPQIEEIDSAIGGLSIQLAMMNFKKAENHEAAFQKLKTQILDLRGRRVELLTSLGLPQDYLEMRHQCKKCQDTGYIRNLKCSCYKQKMVDIYHRTSDFNDLIRTYTFETFKLELFSPSPSEFGLSPRKNMENILEKVMGYIRNFEETDENLLFFGSPGTGKTFLSSCLAKELMDRGHLVIYRTADGLIQNLKEVKFHENVELLEILLNCDLLVIDDLGTEFTTDFAIVELFNFLNMKLLRKKKMLISTNLSIDGLKDKYQERIMSRLMGDFTLHKFFGEDLRIMQNTQRMRRP